MVEALVSSARKQRVQQMQAKQAAQPKIINIDPEFAALLLDTPFTGCKYIFILTDRCVIKQEESETAPYSSTEKSQSRLTENLNPNLHPKSS